MRQIVNVNAAGGNVGGHQGADVSALEARQCLRAGSLALVAVQRQCLNTVLGQELGHVVGAELCAGEHQHLAPVVLLNDVRKNRFFLATTHRVNQLGDALHRGVARCHLHALWVLEQSGCQVANFVTEGGREQQALLVLGHYCQYFFHVMDETHVQHTVCFVENQYFDLA